MNDTPLNLLPLWPAVVVTALLLTATLLLRSAGRASCARTACSAPAGLAGVLVALALLLSTLQDQVWSVGQVLVWGMVMLAHLAAQRPITPWRAK